MRRAAVRRGTTRSAGTGSYSTGDYTLHISNSQPFQPSAGPNAGDQLSDVPKYRWLDLAQTTQFSPEQVAPADYLNGPGSCEMVVPDQTTCFALGFLRGCKLIGYDFQTPPPSAPADGFECCGWQAKCELTCLANSCTGGEICPDACPNGDPPPSSSSYCWNSNLSDCAAQGNQAACNAEELRLRGQGPLPQVNPPVPDCCFLGRGVEIAKWGSRENETPIFSPGEVYPDQCLPEPSGLLGLGAGAIVLGSLARRRSRSRNAQ